MKRYLLVEMEDDDDMGVGVLTSRIRSKLFEMSSSVFAREATAQHLAGPELYEACKLFSENEMHTSECDTAREIPFPCSCGSEALSLKVRAALAKADGRLI